MTAESTYQQVTTDADANMMICMVVYKWRGGKRLKGKVLAAYYRASELARFEIQNFYDLHHALADRLFAEFTKNQSASQVTERGQSWSVGLNTK